MNTTKLWNRQDLIPLFQLDILGPRLFRTKLHDLNQQKRIFGGQLLAQAAAAAAQCVDKRMPTCLSGLFLHGAVEGQPIEYSVEILQQGKRFTSCRVLATQGDIAVLDSHLSFQVEEQGIEHAIKLTEPVPSPEHCMSMDELHEVIAERLKASDYTLIRTTTLEVRLVAPEQYLFQPNPSPEIAYWIRPRHPVPDEPITKTLATIYASDYLAAYCVASMYQPMVGARDAIHFASLNHAIWIHSTPSPNDWLYVTTVSPRANSGRGLSNGKMYSRGGNLVASFSQECSVVRKLSEGTDLRSTGPDVDTVRP